MSIALDPSCPTTERGICLIVGTAPCWREDYEAALAKFPDADVCLINEASKLGIPAKHFATCHPEKIDYFLPADSGYLIHVKECETPVTRNHYRHPTTLGASSAMFAAAVMISLGYELAVLCGCPMNGGGGYAPEIGETHPDSKDDPRVGFVAPTHNLIRAWHNQLAEMPTQYPQICAKIRSMSGHTKELFGGIDDHN